MAILSYGAFSLSFVFSVLYLFQYRLLKKKKWGKWLLRIEDLSKLDHMAYVLNLIGVPMLLLSLILGIIWSYVSLETLYWADPKVLGSIVLLFLYGYYLFIRIVKEPAGKDRGHVECRVFSCSFNQFLFARQLFAVSLV